MSKPFGPRSTISSHRTALSAKCWANFAQTMRRKRMTDLEIIHLLTVICGTILIIVVAGVFITIRDRQQRDDEEDES
jgi:hypothetical protein